MSTSQLGGGEWAGQGVYWLTHSICMRLGVRSVWNVYESFPLNFKEYAKGSKVNSSIVAKKLFSGLSCSDKATSYLT